MKNVSNRKRNTILWLVSWAVLFLVVAYSPIGRPDLYVGTSYRVYNQSVSFKGGIANAPKGKVFSEDLNADMPSLTYSPVGNNGEYEGNASRFNPRSSSSATSSYNRSSSNESGTGYTNAVIALNSGRSSAQGTSTAQNNDVSSLSSDLAMTSSATDRQAAKDIRNNGGGTDPGGDPTGNPIPVGDGMYVLLSMAAIYAVWKMKISSYFK